MDLVNVLELRVSLETESAGLAASRRNLRQLGEMQAAVNEFAACAAGGKDTIEADFRFHLAIAGQHRTRTFSISCATWVPR